MDVVEGEYAATAFSKLIQYRPPPIPLDSVHCFRTPTASPLHFFNKCLSSTFLLKVQGRDLSRRVVLWKLGVRLGVINHHIYRKRILVESSAHRTRKALLVVIPREGTGQKDILELEIVTRGVRIRQQKGTATRSLSMPRRIPLLDRRGEQSGRWAAHRREAGPSVNEVVPMVA